MSRSLSVFVISMLLSFNLYAVNDPSATIACFNTEKHCMAVVDAGSSGSRLHLYTYSMDKNNTPIHIQEIWVKTQSPGLSSVPNDAQAIDKYLSGLFEDFPVSDTFQITTTVPMYFYGTAGMRLHIAPDAMYSKVQTYLQKSPIWDLKEARTITGNEEGIHGWLAMNYHLGLLEQSLDNQKKSDFAGYMDMGGASVQIVMPVDERNFKTGMPDYVKLNMYGQEYALFVHSFLGLGQNQVNNQFMEKASCYAHGYPMTNKQPGIGDALLCEESISRLVTHVHEVDAIVQPVLQDNPTSQWYITGSVGHNAKNKLFDLGNAFTNKTLLEKGTQICASDWKVLQAEQPDNAYLYGYCMFASYYYALMVKGYGFHPEQQIKLAKGNPEWPLGVVLQSR